MSSHLIKTVTVIGGGLMGSGIAQASICIREFVDHQDSFVSIGCCCN